MLVFPSAKINLGLYVTAKRQDGYHTIETVFYPVKELSDMLEIVPSEATSFFLSGIEVDGKPDDNLCMKAYNLLAKDFDLPPVNIYLHKIIPLGAGLGGGSSDAAFVLSSLNKLFDLHLDKLILKQYAATLGSDCSFFIDNTPSIASGRGEVLEPITLDLSAWFLYLVKPDIHISTADAYRGICPAKPSVNLGEIIKQSPDLWKGNLSNDFERTIFAKYPLIREIKDRLYKAGASYASMSGSGASVFGLFKEKPDLNFPACYTWCSCKVDEP